MARTEALDDLLVELFMESRAEAPRVLWLDLDATDDPLHGTQEGRFFHGYYRCYCYLPLYVFCGDHLLRARLRRADEDPAAGAIEELAPVVEQLRRRWPGVRIVLRGDSGFCRDAIMHWCEAQGLDYLFGLARNERLVDALAPALEAARAAHERSGQPARRFADFEYRTRDSWSRSRRVVGKAEHLAKGANPRFVVTSLVAARPPRSGCTRSCTARAATWKTASRNSQLDLFADRTSAREMRGNQLSLYFSSFAYVLLHGLMAPRHARHRTGDARSAAPCCLKLLEVAVRVSITARRVCVVLPTRP